VWHGCAPCGWPPMGALLTALHNFHLRRADGTTAAERLFGQSHPPLFEQVLERMPWPARPAQRRPRPPKPTYLLPVAAYRAVDQTMTSQIGRARYERRLDLPC
jgi:hypothetical protein